MNTRKTLEPKKNIKGTKNELKFSTLLYKKSL